jgi:hypothetical protein
MSSGADPAHGVEAVVLDTDLTRPGRALYVGTTGNVSLVASDGSSAQFNAVPGGTLLPVRCRRVNSAGTTSTNLVSLY